jgi:adenosylmethionine-8-amino-7-oxononanoate aminotransferase
MFDKIKAMPWTVLAAIAFLMATTIAAVIAEPVLMGGVIFVVLLFVSIVRILKYIAEGR